MDTEPQFGWAVTTSWEYSPGKRFMWGDRYATRTEAITNAVKFWHSPEKIEEIGRANLWKRMKRNGFRCERVVLATFEDLKFWNPTLKRT